MKRRMLGILLILCVIVACSSALVPSARSAAEQPVQAAAAPAPDADRVRAARFLNMLNHNFSYNEDFLSVDTLVNNAAIALLDRRDADRPEFIAASFVSDYMASMYGITAVDLSAINVNFPQRDGYLYIIPRGYDVYSHRFVSAVHNEDGTWTVTTEVAIAGHDGDDSCLAVSLFVEDSASLFGYYLLRSDLVFDTKTA